MPRVSSDIAIKDYFLAQRYASAWQEINARIQSRQTVSVTYTVATSAGVLALLTAISQDKIQHWFEFIAIWPVLMAWAFAFWNRHNDAIIGILGSFCRECERVVDEKNTSGVPSFHMEEQGWIVKGREYRKRSDWGLVAAYLFGAAPSLALTAMHVESGKDQAYIFLHIGVVILIGCACFYILKNAGIRNKLASGKFVEHNGKWQFVVEYSNAV